MNIFLIAFTSILLSVAAQFSLKAGMGSELVKQALSEPFSLSTIFSVLGNKFVFGGFLLYGIGAIVWLAVLVKWDVSKAYPLVGLGFFLTLAIGFFLGEEISAQRVVGVALICAGVIAIGRT